METKLQGYLKKFHYGVLTATSENATWQTAMVYLQKLMETGAYQFGCIVTKYPETVATEYFSEHDNKNNAIVITSYDDFESYVNLGNAIIIFDSFGMMPGVIEDSPRKFYDFILPFRSINTDVIIVTEFDIDNETIGKFNSVFRDKIYGTKFYALLSDKIFTSTAHLGKESGKLHSPQPHLKNTVLTEFQKAKIKSYYSTNKDKAVASLASPSLDPADPSLKRYFNIAYKFEIEKLMNDENNTIGLQELINIFGVEEMLRFSPKFNKLIDFIALNNQKFKKHVIFSQYDDAYGLDFLHNILVAVKQNVARVSTSFTVNEEDEYNTITSFNSDENLNILLLDRLPIMIPRYVTHFHIIDGNLEDALVLVDYLFKNLNYDEGMDTSLHIHLHCSSEGGDKLSDDVELAFDRANMESFRDVVIALNESRQIRYDIKGGKKVHRNLDLTDN